MIEKKIARRYAKSLISLSNEHKVLEAVSADMQLFISVCRQNHNLELMLLNPVIHADKKRNVLLQIFSGKMNKMTITFFEIVIRKGREKYLIEIAKEFSSQYKFLKRILTAEIISAVGLDDQIRKKVYDLLRNDSNSEVELVEKVNSKLIGGFILRIGDKQYDASVSTSLRKLTQTFAANPVVRRN